MALKALITGITGQDGSYLAELLLYKGYEVHGIARQTSQQNITRVEHIGGQITIHHGDMTDYARLQEIIHRVKPDEVYNLAAQSHVHVSFEQPLYTTQVNAVAPVAIMDALRESNKEGKFYQAATSEMFGEVTGDLQDEDTPFHPRSPYACSKVAAYYQTMNYREAYGLWACNGILFNHESVPKNTPIIVRKKNGWIDILPIEDAFKSGDHRYDGLLATYIGQEIWNGTAWTKVVSGTAYRKVGKPLRIIQTRKATIETTLDHVVFLENGERENNNVVLGDRLESIDYPPAISVVEDSPDFVLAKFIGFIVGDGHINVEGNIRLTGCDPVELEKYAKLLTDRFGWDYRINSYGPGGFDGCENNVFQLDINNPTDFGKWLRGEIYTINSSEKRVPCFLLNTSQSCKKAFFEGYYAADGRKAGHEKYKWKGFTTSSATLCLGLINILLDISPAQIAKCKCEYREGRRYYYVQLRSPDSGSRGGHLLKDLNEVVSITNTTTEDGWHFDLQTESHTFAAGASLCKIHNSPRRGEMFVTRKITRAATRIKEGLQKRLVLGNIDSRRDWGFAGDYVEAMWKMLNIPDKPEDFVIATGVAYKVEDFLSTVFHYLDLDWQEFVVINNGLKRPSEVNYLRGDASKAKVKLGWKPRVDFFTLAKIMTEADWEIAKAEKQGKTPPPIEPYWLPRAV